MDKKKREKRKLLEDQEIMSERESVIEGEINDYERYCERERREKNLRRERKFLG